jgi:hypothetical protein
MSDNNTTPIVEFPNHLWAGRIADVAKRWGFSVRRGAGGHQSRSAYVYCNGLKIRVADHPPSKRERRLFLDVAVGIERPGAVAPRTAIKLVVRKAKEVARESRATREPARCRSRAGTEGA